MLLTVHVKPRAKRNAVSSWLDADTVKIDVTAVPEGGKANEAVIDVLAEELNVPKSAITIVRGATARMKHVRVAGWTPRGGTRMTSNTKKNTA